MGQTLRFDGRRQQRRQRVRFRKDCRSPRIQREANREHPDPPRGTLFVHAVVRRIDRLTLMQAILDRLPAWPFAAELCEPAKDRPENPHSESSDGIELH
jgi:hypothetical protein